MINDIDINEIVLSNKLPFDKQDFIGSKDFEKIRPSCIFHPQMIMYKINSNENRRINFFIKEEKVFIKYMEILEVSNIIKNKFNR